MLDAGSQSSAGQSSRTPLLVLFAHVVGGLVFLSPVYIRPDSVAVYAWLRSLVFDRDLLFFNEWAGFGMIGDGFAWFKESTPVGALANHWWIGTSLLSAPFYCLAFVMKALFSVPGDGFSGLYQMTLGWASVLFAGGALVASERILAGLGVGLKERLGASVAIWIGTPLFWYEYRFPLGTHAAGALCVGALTWLLWSGIRREMSVVDGALIGLVLGLSIATRLQHLVLALPVLYLIGKRGAWRLFPALTAGTILPLAIQATAWTIVYGHPLGPLVRGANLQGVTWMPFRSIALFPVLFSSFHGLFSWSPVVVLALVGCAVAPKENRLFSMILILMFAAELVANSAFDRYWWGGMSFGPRRFTDLAAPFAIGIGFLLTARARVIAWVLTTLSVLWSALLIAAALSGHLNLEHDVSPDRLVHVALFNGLRLSSLHSTIADNGLRLPSVIALLIVLATAVVLWCLGRQKRLILPLSLAYLTAALILLASTSLLTHQRAQPDQKRFRLRLSASATGPLLDQRKLIGEEAVYLTRTGSLQAAAQTNKEMEQIDRLLRSPANR